MGSHGVGKYSLYKLLSNDIVPAKDSEHSAIYIDDFNKIELPQKILDIKPLVT